MIDVVIAWLCNWHMRYRTLRVWMSDARGMRDPGEVGTPL